MPKPKPTLGDRLCNLISSLEKNDNFAVSGLVGPPATQAEIEAARKAAKGHLPPGVEEFYSSIGSFNLEWQFTGRIPRLPNKYSKIPELKEYFSTQFKIGRMGAINILPITEIFSSWTESTWFPTESDIARGYDGSGPDDGDGEEWRYIYRHVKPGPLMSTLSGWLIISRGLWLWYRPQYFQNRKLLDIAASVIEGT